EDVGGNIAEDNFCMMNVSGRNALACLLHGLLRHIGSQHITAWSDTGCEFEHGRAAAAAYIENSFSGFRRGVIQRYLSQTSKQTINSFVFVNPWPRFGAVPVLHLAGVG